MCLPATTPLHWVIDGPSTRTGYKGFSLQHYILRNKIHLHWL